jgi:hypothetical protein
MACAGGRTLPAFLTAFGRDTRRGLAEVKAEIDADRRARAARGNS